MNIFENVDIIKTLRAIMEINTKHYQTDFNYDVDKILRIAKDDYVRDKNLIWISRESGTYCFFERDSYIEETSAYDICRHIQTDKSIKVFAIEIVSCNRKKVLGNILELDFKKYYDILERNLHHAAQVDVYFEDGTTEVMKYREYKENSYDIHNKNGPLKRIDYYTFDEEQFSIMLKNNREKRKENIISCSVNEYIKKLKSESSLKVSKKEIDIVDNLPDITENL